MQLDGRFFNWMELGPEEPHAKIELYEAARAAEGRKPGGRTGIAFDTDDIHEFHKRLSAKGVNFTLPPSKKWGGVLANFTDFDNNLFEVV